MADISKLGSKLKAEFGDPQGGWMHLTVRADPNVVTLTASYTPFDTLSEMVDALDDLATGANPGTIRVMEEPQVCELRFERENDTTTLEVCRRPSIQHGHCRTLLNTRGSTLEMCLPFWRALRNLQSRFSESEFELRWKRPFPALAMERLSANVKRLRDQ